MINEYYNNHPVSYLDIFTPHTHRLQAKKDIDDRQEKITDNIEPGFGNKNIETLTSSQPTHFFSLPKIYDG